MESPHNQLPSGARASFREIFPRPVDRAMAYGRKAVYAITKAVHYIDDALVHGNEPEKLENLSMEREADQRRRFAAWTAEHCAPAHREAWLAKSQQELPEEHTEHLE